ncbi:LacI family DNA-binding transcriptional regulator [Nonomuraea sp. NPDC050556]|uniref:LacI family DNA-binding transcriptional regulator n=1 Tax=Nonomuraea sp. NPDC050556 TaxID=3364369 RepID=UPI0037BC8FF9
MTRERPSVPTLRDVADAVGVHATTVSRALNPKTRSQVGAETVKRIMKAADSLGYRPNPIARSLKTSRSATVGLVIPDLTNPLFPPIVRGAEAVLEAAGYSALIVNTDSDLVRERARVESLRSRQVEGFIIATALLDHPLLRELHEQGARMVLVNRKVETLQIPSVVSDDADGIAQAVRHLVELGHVRIAHLAGPRTTSTGLLRARAFRHAVQDHDLPADPSLIVECTGWNEAAGARALAGLLDGGNAFTAVVAGNDLIALGCYDVLAERGLSCPGDLSVVGFNDIPFLDKLRTPLTTVRLPHVDLGAEAARMLIESIEDSGYRPRSLLLPATLTVRASTTRPHTGQPSRTAR